ncbi:MAG: DUF4388 domain-containing protein [Planctomycetes bacterium]|nr:DUF4388 domain-containing protein [Planctomycetota bacterium]
MQNDHRFPTGDYLQMVCIGMHSVRLEVFMPDAQEPTGALFVQRGVLWNARDGIGAGEGAARRLLRLVGATALCRPLSEDPGPRKITVSAQSLLIEAAVEQDHSKAPLEEFDAAALVDAVPAPLPAEEAPTPAREEALPSLRELVLAAREQERVEEPQAPSLRDLVKGGARTAPPRDVDAVPSLRDLVVGERSPAPPPAPAPPHDPVARRKQALLEEATEAVLFKDYAAAREHLERALELAPDDAQVRDRLEQVRQLMERKAQ